MPPHSDANFRKTVAALTLTSIGDRIASAKTTLPWLLGVLGAPTWCAGLLVPIRESGSMLPQLVISHWVRRRAVRKWIWVGGSLMQAACLLAIAWAGVAMRGIAAGLTVLALLALFSLGRAASSLASKDVMGKTIAKDRRGRLNGWKSALAGIGVMATGAGLGWIGDSGEASVYAMLLVAAALLWFIAAATYATITELPEEPEPEDGAKRLGDSLTKMRLLRTDARLRRFVIARALAMGSGLAAPYYLILARNDLSSGVAALGTFILAEGLAGSVSSPVWGRWADRSSRVVFAIGCGLAALLSLAVAAWSWSPLSGDASRVFYPLVFFALGFAHAGVRIGRKTQLVNMAEGNQRTDYVAVSNTAMGILLLATGLVSALASLVSVEATLILLATSGFFGAWLGLKWETPGQPAPLNSP